MKMILDAALEFSDAQALGAVSSGNSVLSTNAVDLRTGMVDTWGSAKVPELGNAVWNCRVNVAMVGAGSIVTANLVTKAADASLSSGATVLASLTFPAVSAAGVKKALKLLPGTTALRYLGVLYTVSGAALTSGTFDSFLSLDNEAV
jgi:hypothetical protein